MLPTRPWRDPGRRNTGPSPRKPRTYWLIRLHEELERTRPR